MPDEKPPDPPVYRDPIDPLPEGLVRPKGPRKVSKQKKRADQIKIAAGLGKGGALREIAQEVGLSKTMVVHVRDKIDAGKDPVLARIREKAREELATAAIDALRPTIARMKEKINEPETRLSDMAQSARALNEIAFPAEQQFEVAKSPMADLAQLSGGIAAELLIQLKAHEDRNAKVEREVDGERVE